MSTKKIIFKQKQIDDLEEFRERYKPNEAPTILAGHFSNSSATVEKIYYLDSCEKNPCYFEIDPIDYYNTVSKIYEDGYEIVGIFHTHPGSPLFSGIDEHYMRAHPDPIVWTIMGEFNTMSWLWVDYLTVKLIETEIV
jgi:proteasome lid subunit RPN8/RPN11